MTHKTLQDLDPFNLVEFTSCPSYLTNYYLHPFSSGFWNTSGLYKTGPYICAFLFLENCYCSSSREWIGLKVQVSVAWSPSWKVFFDHHLQNILLPLYSIFSSCFTFCKLFTTQSTLFIYWFHCLFLFSSTISKFFMLWAFIALAHHHMFSILNYGCNRWGAHWLSGE